MSDALQLAAYQGRDAVFDDDDEVEPQAQSVTFADIDVVKQPFKEQMAFFEQKRVKPTKSFTDALRGDHDRSFVIAGATDMAMLQDFQTVIAGHIRNGGTLDDFRKDFDRITTGYGWQYKGEPGWRSRVIFETNVRTSYMAGRLKQMSDPDVIKSRPLWEYRHAETRVPKSPRRLHVAWNGLCLMHDDPWWKKHFPPNDYLCSCGVRTRSLSYLKKVGKSGPDKAPEDLMAPTQDPVTGRLVEKPQGIGWGWDYQPGATWEQGVTPSLMPAQGNVTLDIPTQAVSIDTPQTIDDLAAESKPFQSQPLQGGLPTEEYVKAFLQPFGADIDKGVLWQDVAGSFLPISDQLFRDQTGQLTGLSNEQNSLTPLMAETLLDPDEIWLGVARKANAAIPDKDDLVVDRRYIRVDRKSGLQIAIQIGDRLWQAVTSVLSKKDDPASDAIDQRRSGKLLFKRKT